MPDSCYLRKCAKRILTLSFSSSNLDLLYPIRYYIGRVDIRQTATYSKWFTRIKDIRAKARIDVRIRRLSLGNPGDVKPVGKGVSELRVDVGKGYRVYFSQRGDRFIMLLVGGDKSTQQHDIEKAISMASEL